MVRSEFVAGHRAVGDATLISILDAYQKIHLVNKWVTRQPLVHVGPCSFPQLGLGLAGSLGGT